MMDDAGFVHAEAVSIQVYGGDRGVATVAGWCWRTWFVYAGQKRNGWTLTHAPTGLKLGDHFPCREAAEACAREIDPLNNDWSDMGPEKANRLYQPCIVIIEKHGGRTGQDRIMTDRRPLFAERRNGF